MPKVRNRHAATAETEPARFESGVAFDDLETIAFAQKLRPAAEDIYLKLWPGCRVEYIRNADGTAHTLDQHFGIDALVILRSGQYLTIQEKYREHAALKYGDFTQEWRNGDGSEGEYFHLAAQLYFYGWAIDDIVKNSPVN